MNTTNKLFNNTSSEMVIFEIDSDMVVIGDFNNALEGAILWQAGKQPKTWLSPTEIDYVNGAHISAHTADMFMPVFPGLWQAEFLVAGEPNSGIIIWHEEYKRNIKYLHAEIEEGEPFELRLLDRYSWGDIRHPKDNEDWPDDANCNDLLNSLWNLFRDNTCFFCPPQLFLDTIIPVIKEKSVGYRRELNKKLDNFAINQNALKEVLLAAANNAVPLKYKKDFRSDLMKICSAKTFKEAVAPIENFKQRWNNYNKTEVCIKAWNDEKFKQEHFAKCDFIDRFASSAVKPGNIASLNDKGVVCCWKSEFHMTGKILFETSGSKPTACAFSFKDY